MFVLARGLAGPVAGLAAAAVFAAQAMNPKMLGFAAYAEHFVLLFVVAGSIALLAPAEGRHQRLVLAGGFLFGLAFLMKQSAAVFVAGGALYVLLSSTESQAAPWSQRVRTTAIFLAGALAPFALACLALAAGGTLSEPSCSGPSCTDRPIRPGSPRVRSISRLGSWPSRRPPLSCSPSAAIGLVALLRDRPSSRRTFVLLLAAASFVGTAVGLHFRPQYCLLMLPALAVLAVIGLDSLGRLLAARPRPLRWAVMRRRGGRRGGAAALRVARRALRAGPDEVSRPVYGRNPFAESVQVARYIREHTAPGDRVAVVGSEPQIYFYAGRRAATGYIYTYPLMELQPYAAAMQQQMIREIESADPRYLVFVRASRSWLMREHSDQTIFGWFEQYQRSFKRVGVADILVAAGRPCTGGTATRGVRAALRRVADGLRAREEAMIGEGLTYEQHEVGATYQTLGRTVSETDIVTFVNLCGFTEPLFMDMEYVARESLFKRRAAPGALTFALSEGLIMQTGLIHGTGMAYLGGEMRVTAPVLEGDTLTVRGGGRRQARDPEARSRDRHLPPPCPEPARRAGAGRTHPADDPPRGERAGRPPRALASGWRSRSIGPAQNSRRRPRNERTNRPDQRLARWRPEDGGDGGARDALGLEGDAHRNWSTTGARSARCASTRMEAIGAPAGRGAPDRARRHRRECHRRGA